MRYDDILTRVNLPNKTEALDCYQLSISHYHRIEFILQISLVDSWRKSKIRLITRPSFIQSHSINRSPRRLVAIQSFQSHRSRCIGEAQRFGRWVRSGYWSAQHRSRIPSSWTCTRRIPWIGLAPFDRTDSRFGQSYGILRWTPMGNCWGHIPCRLCLVGEYRLP